MSDHERVRKRADGSDSKIFGFARFMEKIRICSQQQQQQRPIHSCVDNMGRHPHIVVILKFSSLTQWARFYWFEMKWLNILSQVSYQVGRTWLNIVVFR